MSCERQLLLGVAGALSLFAGGAMAQPAPDPVAAALFREGRDLIKEGRWDEGCPKIEASLERFPAASPQLNLALCEEHGGRVATAWAMAQRAQTLNRETVGKKRRASLDAAARELIARLEPRLPYLTVRVVPAVDGARVQEEDGELPLDTPVPLDPGEHQLRLEAPGYATSERVVVLREGEAMTVELGFPHAPPSPAPGSTTEPPAAPPEAAPPPAPAITDTGAEPEGIGVWVWLTGGAGLVLGGLAVGFAVDAVNAAGELEAICGADLVCNEDPDFDPDPLNARKNRGAALAIGLGIGAALGLGAAALGLALHDDGAPARALVPRWRSWASLGGGGAVSGGLLVDLAF